MKFIKMAFVVAALTLFSGVFNSGVRADDFNKKTVITFSQPVEIPGQVLPAGTYTFKLAYSTSDRHIVEVYNADGSRIIATILAIPDWRLRPTGKTVVKFAERAGDNPDAVRVWFYPGDNFGQEFVYPKKRAMELAVATKEPVPAMAVDEMPADLKTAPIEAVTPEQKEVPVQEAIAVTPPAAVADPTPLLAQNTMPKTASQLPLIVLLGFASLGCAFFVKRFAMDKS
jgi:hypothetical protein